MGDMVAFLVHAKYRQYLKWKLRLGALIRNMVIFNELMIFIVKVTYMWVALFFC